MSRNIRVGALPIVQFDADHVYFTSDENIKYLTDSINTMISEEYQRPFEIDPDLVRSAAKKILRERLNTIYNMNHTVLRMMKGNIKHDIESAVQSSMYSPLNWHQTFTGTNKYPHLKPRLKQRQRYSVIFFG